VELTDSTLEKIYNDVSSMIEKYEKTEETGKKVSKKYSEGEMHNLEIFQKYLHAFLFQGFLPGPADEKFLKHISTIYYLSKTPTLKLLQNILICIISIFGIIFLTPFKLMALIFLAITGLLSSFILIPLGIERKLIFISIVLVTFIVTFIKILQTLLVTGKLFTLFINFLIGLSMGIVASMSAITLFLFGMMVYFFVKSGSLEETISLIDAEKKKHREQAIFESVLEHKTRIKEVLQIQEEIEINTLTKK
jgi:hypothetical protein